ncbi:glutamyl-tRNA reductase [Pseudarthrobacter sp. NPDC058329]|uniref:glutamyl-tRNA reductase n=1 Tax=Pseudarthrobacter sp. NPDC058329 TaxID=3346448 RepID=UPI0036DAFFEC
MLTARYRYLPADSTARLQSASSLIAKELACSPAISGCVVLSTCNRFEIYCELPPSGDVAGACSEVLRAVGRCARLPLPDLRALFEYHHGPEVAEHLFGVGCGLDSLVVGERHVTGQVRRALAEAQAAGTATGRLSRLFQTASRTAKDVGARTRLGAVGRSVASVALELAMSRLNPAKLSDLSVVLIGSGSYAACFMELLGRGQGPGIAVYSHSGRAEAFAAARCATPLTAEELPAAIGGADVVIGCSGSGTRIGTSVVASRQGTSRRLVLLDLAPTQDFDPGLANVPGVEIITLESVREAAPPADAEELQLARALVRQAARRFDEQESVRAADTAIVALRNHLNGVLEREMDRGKKQNGDSAPTEETALALRRMVRQLLHEPSVRARELAAAGRQDEYTAALEVLFGLSVNNRGQAGLRQQSAGV